MPDIRTEDLEADGGKKPTATSSMIELDEKGSEALASFSAWLRVLASKAEKWSKSTLRFVEGPKETVDLIRSFPAKIKRYSSIFRVKGTADSDASFVKALSETLSWAKKTLKALVGEDQKSLASKVEGVIKELETIDKIVEALENVENEPTVAMKDEEED